MTVFVEHPQRRGRRAAFWQHVWPIAPRMICPQAERDVEFLTTGIKPTV